MRTNVEKIIISYVIRRECINSHENNEPKPAPYDILEMMRDIDMGDARFLEHPNISSITNYGMYKFHLIHKDDIHYELKVWIVQ
ncbi:MAG: hypothetical protein ACOCQD_02790 [archaeon]